ncbi:MAG TPA: hypothetical protein GXX29_11745 [Firmicutes bacterium]|nr:hypothetical protein [Bacillota bacterium]
MRDYIFAQLDDTDLHELSALEKRLSQKHRRPVVLVAYSEHGGEAEEDAFASMMTEFNCFSPDEYGPYQAAVETGNEVHIPVGVTD